jgi:hypothetical protein
MRSPWKGRGPMGKTVTLTGLIVALALAGCGSDSMEQRSGRTECPHVQQGHTYAVCGGVAIQEPPPEGGPSRVDGAGLTGTPAMVGQKFEVRGGTFLGTQ